MIREIAVTVQALWGTVTRLRYGSGVVALIHGSGQGLFALGVEDVAMGRHLRRGRPWGERQLAALDPYITGEAAVLVVGAHVGTLAIPLARSAGRVVAIEPNPETFRLLTANLCLNSITNCRPIGIAAGDRDEEIEFLLSRVNSGGSKRVPRKHRYVYYFDRPRTARVRAARLDDGLRDERFDVIVMDVEGSEFVALQGMQRLLGAARVLQVEFEPHHLRDVAGISVGDFLSVIQPHFTHLVVPSKGLRVGRAGFGAALSDLYRANQRDDGLLFSKS